MPKVAMGPDPMQGGGNVPKEVPPIIIEACPWPYYSSSNTKVVRAAGNKTKHLIPAPRPWVCL
jgi:hypothetical protein